MASDRPRRPLSVLDAAEAAFKTATTPPASAKPQPVLRPALPKTKTLVSLRIDQDVLDHFQDQGLGWQDRLNDTLRKALDLG